MTYDYKNLVCPNCKMAGIVPIGEVEFSENAGPGGDGVPKEYQVFTHPGCTKINPITLFTNWTYEVSKYKVIETLEKLRGESGMD